MFVKAANQLEKRKAWLSNASIQRRIFGKLSWNFEPTKNVHTCIAIGNRVFTGYECNGHPVRQTHEILNLLQSGIIDTDGVSRRLWKSELFSVEDLYAHIKGTTIISDQMNSMYEIDKTISFDGAEFTFSSYDLDAQKIKNLSEAKYPFQP